MVRISILYDTDIQQRVFRIYKERENEQKVETSLSISATKQANKVKVAGVLKDANNTVIPYAVINVYKNNVLIGTATTNSNGAYTYTTSDLSTGIYYFRTSYMGNDVYENVSSDTVSVSFYEDVIVEYTGESIRLGSLVSIGDVIIDWGDGTSDIVNNPTSALTHTYSDDLESHTIVFMGQIIVIGSSCFRDCTGLTSVTIPNGVREVRDNCFWGCTGLTSVTISDSVTDLGGSCFRDCTGLTSVTIPDGVTYLGSACFMDCTGLTSVTIPNSVDMMGDYCFDGCSALIDYQLYWEGNAIITYDSDSMPNNQNTIFTIPHGQTSNYVNKGYPSDKLQER